MYLNTQIFGGFYVTPTRYDDFPLLLVEEDLRCLSVNYFRHERAAEQNHLHSVIIYSIFILKRYYDEITILTDRQTGRQTHSHTYYIKSMFTIHIYHISSNLSKYNQLGKSRDIINCLSLPSLLKKKNPNCIVKIDYKYLLI